MRARINGKQNFAWVTVALCLALAVLGVLHFGGIGTKWLTLLAGFGVIALLVLGDRKRIWNLPSLLLLGYAAFSWVTIFWAMSGKFHLREGSKILIAVFFFLLVAMHGRFDRAFARRVMGVIAGISALYAFLSVEAVSTGITKLLLERLPAIDTEKIVFNGTRLYGIFGNSNIEASVFAVGVLLSIALVCGAEKKWQRVLWTATLSFCAFAFLLGFSMGAIACFIAAVAVYLIFAGKGRSAALLRMLGAAVPTLVCGFIAFAMFSSERSALVLALLLANAGVSALLELTVSARLSAVLERHERLAFGVLIAVVLGAGVYAVAAMNVTGSYTFGPALYRSEQLSAGEHTIQVEADGAVTVRIYTQNAVQMMSSSSTELYNDVAEGTITITVPEGVKTFFRLLAEPQVTVRRVLIDGSMELPLRYKLLPGFAAYRVQSFGMNNSTMLREMFWGDAVKLWKLSPIVGSGVGAFETGVTAVQDYPYETKYVHQHYLQILLEDGVIGPALYIGALVTMLLALWKRRKQTREDEFYWLYPALCAEFVMNGLQMLWDVSMSMIVFLCMTYALYGLIVGACAEPFAEKVAAAEETGKKKKTQAKRLAPSLLARNIGIGFTVVVVLTLCGNLYAASKADAPVADGDEFLYNLSAAAKLDLYERNDMMLSYVVNSLEMEYPEDYREQADEYAAQLSKVQSNTIPRYLVGYYLQTGQYDKAIDEAILGATYSASNADTWNSCAALLNEALFQSMLTPLLTEDREPLMAKLTAYRDALEAHNAGAYVPVELNEETQAFFDKIVVLNGCMDDDRLFAETLFTT